MKNRADKTLYLVIIIFGVIYSLISLVNHYYFRTYALDLGAYTNAMYDYIHFQWNDSTVFKEVKENLLSDHFDLYLIIFSPLSLIFKSYTLLLIQIFSILSGGFGIYRYFTLVAKDGRTRILATIFFYSFFGVFSAVSSDYHSNVVAASLLPWVFYFLRKGEILATSLMILFLIISKENISLWLAFICLGLMINYKKNRPIIIFLAIASLTCISYFVVITNVIMPWLSNNNSYPHFNYSYLGANGIEAIGHLFSHPFESIKALFMNHTNNPSGDYIKAEFHTLVLLSGLPILFFKPQYIFMLIPIYFQKLFHDSHNIWGIDAQYCIEFAPILAIGIFSVLDEFKNRRMAVYASIIILISTIICSVSIMDHTRIYTAKSKIRFYQGTHYRRNYSVSKVHELISKMPREAVVSAQSPFLPHLALRNSIYQFPIINDAEIIIYSEMEVTYPIERSAFDSLTKHLEESKIWKVEFKDENLTILKKMIVE